MRSRLVASTAILLSALVLAGCKTTSTGVPPEQDVEGADIVSQDDDAVALLESAGVDVNALAARLPEGTQLRLRVNRKGDGDRNMEVTRDQEAGAYEVSESLLKAIEASIMSANSQVGDEALVGLDLSEIDERQLQLEAVPAVAVQTEVLSAGKESSIRKPAPSVRERQRERANTVPEPRSVLEQSTQAVAEADGTSEPEEMTDALDASGFTGRNVVQMTDDDLFGQSSVMRR